MCYVEPPGTIRWLLAKCGNVEMDRNLKLPVASGPVHRDQGGEDADKEEDEHHVLREPDVLGRHHVDRVHTVFF